MRRDEVEAAWSWVEPILAAWGTGRASRKPYPAGTWGPTAAIALIERDGRTWYEDSPLTLPRRAAMSLHPVIAEVTERIAAAAARHRGSYLERLARRGRARAAARGTCPAATSPTPSPPAAARTRRSCSGADGPTSAIVTAYNDMLSAHQPFERFPALIREAAREAGATAQVAGGVPGHVRRRHPGPRRHGAVAVQPRRDRHGDRGRAEPRHVRRRPDARHLRQDRARAWSSARCAFGHLPIIFVPAGPMPSGIPTARRPRSASSTPRARSAARSCSTPRAPPTTRPAPAPSTAPPTPTRC